MQGQANVKLQQNFKLAGVTCKKCFNNTITKTFQYKVPVLASNRVSTICFKRKFYCQLALLTFWRRLLQHSGRPSNGFELLHFFEDAVDGSVLLECSDCVVMGNCGFHRGLFVEPVLRELLNDYGVQLIYQPPYCPHLNTCEYCFHQLKEFLRRCHILAMEEENCHIRGCVVNINN